MSESINALVKAQEQGVEDFDALPDKVHTELNALATQINALEGGLNKTSVATRLEQANLLNKGYILASEDFNTFGAWFNDDNKISEILSISAAFARKIINLAKFAKGKKAKVLEDIQLTALYELAQPKWVTDSIPDPENPGAKIRTIDKDKVQALGKAYSRLTQIKRRNQNAAKAKELILHEWAKLGYAEPAKPTAYAKPVVLSDVKDSLERNFNDYRMNFKVNEGELEELANYVDDLMDDWVPGRRQKALPPPLTDIETGFNWIDTLEQQDIRELIAYAQEKLDG